MKPFLMVLFMLFIASVCFAGEYALYFLAIDPSSINRAIGGDAVGVVNIWHNSPALVYANPAIAAFRQGVSVSYTRDQWLEGSGIEDMYYNCGLMNIGYKGIGLTLPAINAEGKLGITMDYGSQEMTDETGQSLGTFSSWEDTGVYGIAINPVELARNYLTDSPILPYFDLAVGINYLTIDSNLGPGTGESEYSSNGKATANCTDIGMIAAVNYTWNDLIKLEGVYGLSSFNYNNDEIEYINAGQKDPIYTRTSEGYAFSVSLQAEKMVENYLEPRFRFFDNLLSLRFLSAKVDEDNPEDTIGEGYEVGFLDTFYFRSGRYEDEYGHITGNTSGYGINLHYKDLLSYNFNYATFPGGELTDDTSSTDHNVSVDFLQLAKLLKNK